jgi:uncharacterized membrane protein
VVGAANVWHNQGLETKFPGAAPYFGAATLAERRGVMVLSWLRGAHARRKQTRETFAMDPWIASGCFLLGAGVGSLVSAALHAKEIRKLKNVLEAARNNSQTEDKDHCPKPDGRKSA